MKNEKFFRIACFVFLLGVIFWNVGSTVFAQKEKYLSHTYWQNFPGLKMTYLNSQYVNKHPKGWIPDEVVNAYAGGEYIRGVLPQLIAPDTPPLGRYLIGLSAVLFNNENISVFVAFLTSLFLLYLLSKQVFSDSLLALIPVAAITTEPILLNQLVYTPLLDIFQLVFLLAFFILFNSAQNSQKKLLWFLSASFFLGCFIATKFFITGAVMVAAGVGILLLKKQVKSVLLFLLSNSIAVIVLLLTYAQSLFFGYSLKSFLGIQKWIFLYHKSQLILPFSIWPLIMLNKWYVWFGNTPVISDPQWRITWPIVTILTGLGGALYLVRKRKENKNVAVLLLWSLGYLLFFSFGQISARYLVILLPILYICAVYAVWQVMLLLYKKK